jgi:hypothetical protein
MIKYLGILKQALVIYQNPSNVLKRNQSIQSQPISIRRSTTNFAKKWTVSKITSVDKRLPVVLG